MATLQKEKASHEGKTAESVELVREKVDGLTKHEIKQTLLRCRETLTGYGVKRLGLFGSYVRGTADTASDIDLLVEIEPPTFDAYMGLRIFLEDLFEKKIDLVPESSVKARLKPYIEREVEYVEGL